MITTIMALILRYIHILHNTVMFLCLLLIIHMDHDTYKKTPGASNYNFIVVVKYNLSSS